MASPVLSLHMDVRALDAFEQLVAFGAGRFHSAQNEFPFYRYIQSRRMYDA